MISDIFRKAGDYGKKSLKYVDYLRSSTSDLKDNKPVILNSIPKSGTHFLYQIIEALPGLRDKGDFIASIPSLPYSFRPKSDLLKRLNYITPGELVRAHLFYSPEFQDQIKERTYIHFFIYRDPRDLVISEAFYLGRMNKWHGMSRFFKGLSDEERIMLAIRGLDNKKEYPDIGKRVGWYIDWLKQDDLMKIRFEDLKDPSRQSAVIDEIISYYKDLKNIEFENQQVKERIMSNIDPGKSHTYRSGKKKGWKNLFNKAHKDLFKEVAGDLLIKMNYENNNDW
ncbi:sulfotransferase domain-containing protein [Balneola sp. MJW-20]|uniref:sulfotransferase domain-containing protein n=1 Tax=Gracilimonas aurantiaca TaxID=3234185 RepID=UPI0034674AE9